MVEGEPSPVSPDQFTKSPIRILVAENAKPMFYLSEQEQIANKGMDRGIELICINRLIDALDHLNKESFDAAVLDLLLPDSQGSESIKRISERTHLPIIALANADDEGLAIEVIEAGAEDLLVKSKINLPILII
jgi:DNA-binding response OmpR family regulator